MKKSIFAVGVEFDLALTYCITSRKLFLIFRFRIGFTGRNLQARLGQDRIEYATCISMINR